MKSARQRATERYWLASQRALAGSRPAQAMLEIVTTFEADDCTRLRTAALHSLEALSARLEDSLCDSL